VADANSYALHLAVGVKITITIGRMDRWPTMPSAEFATITPKYASEPSKFRD
jgi:hypothetical protein